MVSRKANGELGIHSNDSDSIASRQLPNEASSLKRLRSESESWVDNPSLVALYELGEIAQKPSRDFSSSDFQSANWSVGDFTHLISVVSISFIRGNWFNKKEGHRSAGDGKRPLILNLPARLKAQTWELNRHVIPIAIVKMVRREAWNWTMNQTYSEGDSDPDDCR